MSVESHRHPTEHSLRADAKHEGVSYTECSVHSKDRTLVSQPPHRPLCWAWSRVQRTRGPAQERFQQVPRREHWHPSPLLSGPASWLDGPSHDFFPSRIFFSASFITLSSLGMWPWREKKHMLLVVLSTNSAGAFSRSGTLGDLKMCFLPDRTEREKNPELFVSPSKERNIPGARQPH